MALERIEVRLGNVTVEEQVLSKAIAELPEGRGMKTHFMKERLIRGYGLIRKEVERICEQSDPHNALNRMADSINAGHFYALRAVMEQMSAEKMAMGASHGPLAVPASVLASITPAAAIEAETPAIAPASVAASVGVVEASQPQPEAPAAVPVPPTAPAAVESVQAAPVAPPVDVAVQGPVQTAQTAPMASHNVPSESEAAPPAPAPAPKVPDWSKMRNLATGGGKG